MTAESPSHYFLDFVAHGRLTHAATGKTLVRQGWMRGDQWASALREYVAAHPGDHNIRSYRGHRVGDLRDFPELGGSLSVGDRVLSTDSEGVQSSRLVTGTLPDNGQALLLEDGNIVHWDGMGWSAPSVVDAANKNWAVKIREGDPDPGLDPGAALLSVMRQARELLNGDRDFHSLAGRITNEERESIGAIYTALLGEADKLTAFLKPRMGLLQTPDDVLERGTSLLRRLAEHVEECRAHPKAAPSVGSDPWFGVGRFLRRAAAVGQLLADAGHQPSTAPAP